MKQLTADGTLQMMNRAGLDMIEAESLDQVRNLCVYPLVSEEHRAAFQEMVRNVFRGERQTLEFKMISLKGHPCWLYSQAVPLRNDRGEVVSALSVTVDITERKQAEDALRESENKFRALFNSINDSILIHDSEGRFLEVNDNACRLLGYKREEFLRMSPKDIDTPEAAKNVPANLGIVLQKGEHRFESEQLTRDGRMIPVDVSSRVTAFEGKKAIISVCRDITERKKTERLLRESEGKYRELVETANSVILTWDTEGNVVFLNRFGEQFFGFTREELRGRNVVGTIVPPMESSGRDLALLMREIERDPEQFRDNENENITRDGRRVWVRWANKAIRDGEGKLVGTLSIGNDVTERKEAGEKIRQSEQFIRNILDTVDEGFLVIDRDYRIVTANKAYCAQVAMPCDEVIGKHCHEVSHKTPQPCFLEGEDCAARQVFATGEPHAATHRHRDAHGGTVYVETKCFPIKDGSGTVTSVIETINNITERHLLEEERLKTQKLESVGLLAGGIAHDFNNLLQGIFGYIAMAKLTLDQREKSRSMLEEAEKALHQSVNLTTQLLTFSKGGKPVKKRTSLLPVIENAVKFALSGSRSEHRITSEPGLWQVDADEGQLSQVIQNIVLNADQAMPLGGSVVVTVRNLPAADATRPQILGRRDHVVIAIRDTGVGIPAEYLGRIFDPYFTTKEKGSGLGLATSYSIVRSHDGLITVTSEPGKGSTFLIYLPAGAAREEKPRKEAVPTGKRVGKILVMDDEELIRNVAGELLAALGHTAVFADKGETALEAFRSARESGQPFDAVILDLTIRGGMGGQETLARLLEIDPAVQAVVSSGYSDDATLANYRQQGFKAFLKKPYNIDKLQNTLNALLARS